MRIYHNGINNIKKIVNLLILLISIISSLVCLFLQFNNSNNDLKSIIWLLPLFHLIFFIIFRNNRKNIFNISNLIINSIITIRYSILPLTYYIDRPYINDLIYTNNIKLIVFLMIVELFFTFFLLDFLGNHIRRRSNNIGVEKIYKNSFIGIGVLVILLLGIFVTIRYPQLYNNFLLLGAKGKGIIIDSNISGFYSILYNSFLIITTLFFLYSIKKANIGNLISIFMSLAIIIILLLSIYVGGSGTISRWAILINGIIFISIIINFYPGNTRLILLISLAGILYTIIITTLRKFTLAQNVNIETVKLFFKYIFDYKILNAYFSGPTNIGYALLTKENFRNNISIPTFFNDIFGNFPYINKMLRSNYNNIPYYYNYTIYGYQAKGQICPMIGQGYIYFGLFGSPILSIFATYFAIKFNNMIRYSKNLLYYYFYMFATISCSIFMCINMNIIFQNIWIKVLPIFLIAKFNFKILNRKWEKEDFEKNWNNYIS